MTVTFVNPPDAGTVCTNNSGDVSAGCATDGYLGPFNANGRRRYIPPSGGISGGTCNAFPKKDVTRLTTSQLRLCQATVIPQCGTKVCPPTLSGTWRACIAASGETTCPPEFPIGKTVGTKADFTCGGTCGCNVTGTCTGGVINYYDSTDCSGPVGQTFNANGNCNATPPPGGGTYQSHLYVPNPPINVSCTRTGSSTPSAVQLTQVATVCCN